MYKLAFTHRGYFLKVASKKLFFFSFFSLKLMLQFVLKLPFVVLCLKIVFLIKQLLDVCSIVLKTLADSDFLSFPHLLSWLHLFWMCTCLALVVQSYNWYQARSNSNLHVNCPSMLTNLSSVLPISPCLIYLHELQIMYFTTELKCMVIEECSCLKLSIKTTVKAKTFCKFTESLFSKSRCLLC